MIEIRELSKSYGGRMALEGVSLSVSQGAIFGLVGPRGAGKTTLLKILATLVAPSAGDAFVAGRSVVNEPLRVRRQVGYLPSDFGVYPDQTCAEYIAFFAGCYGVPPKERATLAADLLQLVDLYHRKDTPADRLTPAMRQRLGMARVLAHDPRVLLLDEPLASLDPRAQVEARALLKELSSMGKTILLTAPNLAGVQDLCTHAALLQAGRIAQTGPLEDIRAAVPPYRTIAVKFLGDARLAMNLIQAAHGVVDVQPFNQPSASSDAPAGVALLKELRVTFDGTYAAASALLRSLMHSGVQVVSFAED
ncbi:ATP-binding cassette domain-containing protein [Candidatus Roseilinea sp. NK_OTU-006]|nr:ABC transporter ATP-binding protein [Candidatus Roseilinea sp. NK_OTU-006]